jgi:phospholipase C
MFQAGAMPLDTLDLSAADRAAIPLEHLVIVMQENRSFDHLYGTLAQHGQPDAAGWPANFSNPDTADAPVAPFHLTSTCLPADPPHQWNAMHAGWDSGAMDGFVKSAATATTDGHYVMGYYEATDLPFYTFLATTFAFADGYFGSTLGGTWANRDYLYAATSGGVMSTLQATFTGPNVFDALDQAKVSWGVYTSGGVRQDSLGWNNSHAGVGSFTDFIVALTDGTLPAVSFVDPGPGQDEHPPGDMQLGEAWGHQIYTTAIASPLWSKLAIVYTYDESGGLADHVPPPPACVASPSEAAFDRLGVRVPALVISPWARPHHVSHRTHEHASVLRLIELLHDLPALTARDANSDALLDMFDFGCPALLTPPAAPPPGTGGCP